MPQKLKRRKKYKAGHEHHGPQQTTVLPNSTGLANLPPELLMEIVDYLPRFPVPCGYIESPLKKEIPTRQATLLILVQLCRAFRQALLPYVWEEIVLCSARSGQRHPVDYIWRPHTCRVKQNGYCDSCEKPLAYDIVAQLETVRFRVPEYATRVQTLSIFIPRYCWKTILPEFAECLSLLRNLKTLQFHFASDAHVPQLNGAVRDLFSKCRYRRIQTLVVPGTSGSVALISACPKVRHVHFTTLGDLWNPCPSVQKLTGALRDDIYTDLPQYTPNLKHLQWSTRGDKTLQPLYVVSQLPKLEVVEILLTRPEFKEEAEYMHEHIQAALDQMPDILGTRRRAEILDCMTQSSLVA